MLAAPQALKSLFSVEDSFSNQEMRTLSCIRTHQSTSETINTRLWSRKTKPASVNYFAVVVLATNKTYGALPWRVSVFPVLWEVPQLPGSSLEVISKWETKIEGKLTNKTSSKIVCCPCVRFLSSIQCSARCVLKQRCKFHTQKNKLENACQTFSHVYISISQNVFCRFFTTKHWST